MKFPDHSSNCDLNSEDSFDASRGCDCKSRHILGSKEDRNFDVVPFSKQNTEELVSYVDDLKANVPTHDDLQRIVDLEAKLREVPWTKEEPHREIDNRIVSFRESLDTNLYCNEMIKDMVKAYQLGSALTILWAEKRIKERGL